VTTDQPGSISIDDLTLRFSKQDVDDAYDRGLAEGRQDVERLTLLLEQAEQYARDLQDEAGWNRVEEWGVRVVDPHPRRTEKPGDIIRLAEETARHGPSIWAGWTTVRREVLTSEWEAPDA
jgi:hypothetical protein